MVKRETVRRPDPDEAPALVSFVRATLGCGCPEEVLRDLRIRLHPGGFRGLPVDGVLEVGGRLLVVVCTPEAWREVAQVLPTLLATGQRIRDGAGFNRLRIVVPVARTEAVASSLGTRFSRLAAADERSFLHVVERSRVPAALVPPADG